MTQSADKLMIEELIKERDALALGIDQWRVDYHELRLEYNVLEAAAKLALDALYTASHYTSALPEYHLSDFEINEAIAALHQVDVQ